MMTIVTGITSKLACTIGSASALLPGFTDPSCGGREGERAGGREAGGIIVNKK